ncbi:MAG: hypothetical protein Q8P57_03620 [Candidatus Pacearchaeota archaeon]|nr:hypothetical protein [Candidatus Pacearchaeota archaeon]
MDEEKYLGIDIEGRFYLFPEIEIYEIKVEGSFESFSRARTIDGRWITDTKELERLTDLFCDLISPGSSGRVE